MFWPARPKHLCFDQVRSSEICFDRRDQNIKVRNNFDWPRYVSISTSTNFYVSTIFNPARYVSTGATKTSRFRPSSTSEIRFDRRDQNINFSTKFNQARYVSTGATKTSMFRPSSTKWDMFWSARPKNICFDQVRPCEIRFDRRNKKHLGFDQVRPSGIGFDRHDHKFLCFDQVRQSEIHFDQRNQTSIFRPSSTKRDTFRPARRKHLFFDQTRPSKIRFERRNQNL